MNFKPKLLKIIFSLIFGIMLGIISFGYFYLFPHVITGSNIDLLKFIFTKPTNLIELYFIAYTYMPSLDIKFLITCTVV